MTNFTELLREAKEPPVEEIGGKSYTGRILSHEQFLKHAEALYLIEQRESEAEDDGDRIALARKKLNLTFDFLREVFPEPPIPKKPEKKKENLSLFEKLWYWLSGKDPKWARDYVAALDEWEEKVNQIRENDPALLMMKEPDLFARVARHFTFQWVALMGPIATTNTKNEQSKADSSKSPSEQSKQPMTGQ